MKSKKRRCLDTLYAAPTPRAPEPLLTEGKPHQATFLGLRELERLRRTSWQLDDGHWLGQDTVAEVETLRSHLLSLALTVVGLRARTPPDRLFAMPRDLCAHELGLICKGRDGWLVAPKDDGVRVLLLFLRGKCFFIKREKPYVEDVEPDAPFDEGDGTSFFLLDAELVQHAGANLLRVCDLLAYGDRSLCGLPFSRRLWLRDLFLASLAKDDKCQTLRALANKEFYPLNESAQRLAAIQPSGGRWYFNQGEQRVPVDGLIFASAGAAYSGGVQQGLCKWKFSPTVDLELVRGTGRAALCARAPVPRPSHAPLQLHRELFFDRALTPAGAGALLRQYWTVWSATTPTSEGPEESFCAPRSEAALVFPRAAVLPGAWGECVYNRAKGSWIPSSFVLEGLPLDQAIADSAKWPVRWLRKPGGKGATGGPPVVATPQQVVEELLRQRAGLPPRKLYLRLTGCHTHEGVTHVGLAYSVPQHELAPATRGEQMSASLALLNVTMPPAAVPGIWEIQLASTGAPQLLARRQKDKPNFHTTAMQALRASAAGVSLEDVLALLRPQEETTAAATDDSHQ